MLVRSLAGHGARALLSAGLTLSGDAPEELITRAMPVFLEHYADNICTFSAPYPGLELALEDLRTDGFRIAIRTNKPEELVNHLVEELRPEQRRDGQEWVSMCRSRWLTNL